MQQIKERVESVVKDFLNSKKQGFQYALFFALNLTFFFNPIAKDVVSVKKFSRTFGAGIIANWDCSRVISNYYLWICLFIVLLFGFWIFFSAWKQKNRNEEDNEAVLFLDSFMVLGCTISCIKAFTFFLGRGYALFSYSNIIINIVILSVLLFIYFHISKLMSFDFYLRILISLFSLSIFAVTLVKKTGIRCFSVIVFGFIALAILILKLFRLTEDKKLFSSVIKSSSVTLCFLPLITSLYFELLNIMNSHNLFVFGIRKYYAIASFLLFCCSGILAFLTYKQNFTISFWKRLSYPILVLGFAALCTQPALSRVYGADIFESANLSIPVTNFLYFGKLPIITCYPGHMMQGVWQAFIYAFLNGDKFGAIFSPYYQWIEFPIITVLFYYFVKTVLNEDTALFTAIVFPFAATSCWNYFGMGVLLALSVIFYEKKQTLFRAFLIWIAFVWCALYRLDIGFAFFMATVVSLSILSIFEKNKKSVVQLLISFGITACFGGILWIILCILQGVNPVLRLFEFLKLSASNQTWAYNGIGNVNSNLFVLAYLIVPFSVAFLLTVCILSKSIRENISQPNWILLLIIGFSFFFNMPRGLVRHSLVENEITIVFWTASVFFASGISLLLKKKYLFLPLLALFIIFSIQFVDDRAFSTRPIAESVMPQIKTNLNAERSGKRERVILEQGMKDWCETYKYIADFLLEDDETYVDYMNRTFVYSVIGRENPVYVAQSPLMLSGEFTQEMFIKEIADKIDKIPIAFLPMDDNRHSASLDGIYNSYRYYKVSEFIFTHYKPLLKFGDFAVWVLNERYNEKKDKVFELSKNLAFMKNSSFEIDSLDTNYNPNFHTYNVAYLPILWAEKDVKKAKNGKILLEMIYNGKYYIFDKNVEKNQKGAYFLVHINNQNSDTFASFKVGKIKKLASDDFVPAYEFGFNVLSGEHDYIFRASADYLWYLEKVNAIKFDGKFASVDIKILEAD